MKTLKWLLIAVVGLVGCSKPTPDPQVAEDTKATLNGQAWSGFSTAWKTPSDSCSMNTINLSIQNTLPYPRARLLAPANCAGYCGDQLLSFTRIPLAVGVYTLSAHQPCSANPTQVGVSFMTLIGGDVLRDQYQPQLTKAGTITITKYDSQGGEIEGSFEVTLVRDDRWQPTSDAAETVQFQNGSFRTKLP
ncbi:hypothetical protein [Spirosoma radiotolerans]|uniref:Lipoprotein n=1 Tax=Spirosoma radiotolerans TaxID=1379870 RepID=A0A0E3ZRZ3_9BACT|nr:hypothetical protein [Spirosoma radiotolerans]AKD53869.1 hypothetical protein SD10_02060 [Spirosoma radiotolerans]